MSSYSFPMNIDQISNVQTTLIKQIPSIIIAALILLVTLNWNQSITKLFDYLIPTHIFGLGGIFMNFVYSFILTVVIFFFIYLIIIGTKKLEQFF